MSKNNSQIRNIQKILKKTYGKVTTQLSHKNPFELLIATILSAQCTDKQVNAVTPQLFQKLPTPQTLSKAPIKTIEHSFDPPDFFTIKLKILKTVQENL